MKIRIARTPFAGTLNIYHSPQGRMVLLSFACDVVYRGGPTGGDAPIAGISRVGQRSVEQTCASHSRKADSAPHFPTLLPSHGETAAFEEDLRA
jgi:hypothetical protein